MRILAMIGLSLITVVARAQTAREPSRGRATNHPPAPQKSSTGAAPRANLDAGGTFREERAMDEPQAGGASPASQKVVRTDAQWRARLTPEEFRVLRKKGTEPPFTNRYDHHFEPGTYACAACGQPLFGSDTKFDSGCGWPAFYAALAGDRVVLTPDRSHGMLRTEVTCARCHSHLGHVFDDAPQTPTGQRFCINSVSLRFIPAGQTRPDQPEQAPHVADPRRAEHGPREGK